MSDTPIESGNVPPDDMSAYLQMFLDETDEQLDDLVETLLRLEREPDSANELNEAFRLIHSIKGSAGLMGFDNITVLTHRLENRFESFRSGKDHLDQATMNLVLRCIDFLRDCNGRLRGGQKLGTAGSLLEELRELEERADSGESNVPSQGDEIELINPRTGDADDMEGAVPTSFDSTNRESETPDQPQPTDTVIEDAGLHHVIIIVRFEPDLPLADLKARLIVTRLSGLGEIRGTRPSSEELESMDRLTQFELEISTNHGNDQLRAAINIDGVQTIEIQRAKDSSNVETASPTRSDITSNVDDIDSANLKDGGEEQRTPDSQDTEQPLDESREPDDVTVAQREDSLPSNEIEPLPIPSSVEIQRESRAPATSSVVAAARPKVAKTMRVDIDRLDKLMNLAGELVVNRARFVQISSEIRPALKKSTLSNRVHDLGSDMRRSIDCLRDLQNGNPGLNSQIHELETGLQRMEEQSLLWDTSLRCFGQISEAIDQLTRVSDSLQRGVLETRMIPIGPLFNRFQRVVRDLSVERNKKVNLRIRGEKTELDKRMIDELGDPLVHLVRNSIDHGLESPDVRLQRGKPEVGTITLEATHGGNNVYVRIRDDGGGIDSARIKSRLIDRSILTPAAAEELSEDQLIDFIWHPGFSTAQEVTDISGRGVGMDVVKTRILELSGTVDVRSTPEVGTTFTIRLPLTLAIMNSLLARVHGVVFAIPIDDVREIVSVKTDEIVSVKGQHAIDVRGEYIPLISIDRAFHWHDVEYGHGEPATTNVGDESGSSLTAVILHSGGSSMGMRVDDLLGSQDIVVKSLSENYRDVPGLSGASILGDGTVCLMLDVASTIQMAVNPSHPIHQ